VTNEKKEAVNFLIWGIGLIGIGAFIIVGANFVLSIVEGREFFLIRNLIVLFIGIACVIFSKKFLGKNVDAENNLEKEMRRGQDTPKGHLE
jgi:hypothetical protein